MTHAAFPWSLRRWLVAFAIAVPVVLLGEAVDIRTPSWTAWIGICMAFCVGGAILISPDLASMKRPFVARLVGAILVLAAMMAAHIQLTQTLSE